jgi:hypothetical protein
MTSFSYAQIVRANLRLSIKFKFVPHTGTELSVNCAPYPFYLHYYAGSKDDGLQLL